MKSRKEMREAMEAGKTLVHRDGPIAWLDDEHEDGPFLIMFPRAEEESLNGYWNNPEEWSIQEEKKPAFPVKHREWCLVRDSDKGEWVENRFSYIGTFFTTMYGGWTMIAPYSEEHLGTSKTHPQQIHISEVDNYGLTGVTDRRGAK